MQNYAFRYRFLHFNTIITSGEISACAHAYEHLTEMLSKLWLFSESASNNNNNNNSNVIVYKLLL